MEFDWVEWFGYLASFVVLISLTMTSIIKLRFINLVGCLLFAAFAWLIGSVPTVFMNLGIACINIYFLYQIYNTKEEFKLVNATTDSDYYRHFLSVNRKEIEKQIPMADLEQPHTAMYMLRDNNIAGVLVGELEGEGTLNILLDYVIPRYRDYKLGRFFLQDHTGFFKERGIDTLKTRATDKAHQAYLQKIGFERQAGEDGVFVKKI